MKVVLDGERYRGRAIGLEESRVPATAVRRAIRRPSSVAASATASSATSGSTTNDDADRDRNPAPRRLRVDCAAPGPIHEHVGRIGPATTIDFRAALADAARSCGETAPQRERLERVREQLAAIDVPTEETHAARRAVATAGTDERRLRESVAELRGRVQTLRNVAPDSQRLADAEAELAEAAKELSEAETERLAAEQRLARAERAARRARDARERRLRLQDRAANLRREARSILARRAYPAFGEAVDDLLDSGERATARSDDQSGVDLPREYAGDATVAALAIARIADVDAPIVLESDRFSSATAAATWLDAPVVRVEVQTG